MFRDRKLERDCSDEQRALKRFGKERWSALRKRLASLAAASNIADLEGVPGKCHALTGDRAGQFAMSVTASERLIFVPASNPPPLLPDGGLDRRSVTQVEILQLVDYHG